MRESRITTLTLQLFCSVVCVSVFLFSVARAGRVAFASNGLLIMVLFAALTGVIMDNCDILVHGTMERSTTVEKVGPELKNASIHSGQPMSIKCAELSPLQCGTRLSLEMLERGTGEDRL